MIVEIQSLLSQSHCLLWSSQFHILVQLFPLEPCLAWSRCWLWNISNWIEIEVSWLKLSFPVAMDYPDPKKKSSFVGKIILAAALTALCILMLKQSPSFNTPSMVISYLPIVWRSLLNYHPCPWVIWETVLTIFFFFSFGFW